MALLSDIREGIAANLAAISGVQVSAYMLSDPTPPAIHIVPAAIEYDLALGRGLDRWTLNVQAFVALDNDIGAQQFLDQLIASSGARSVKTAVESDGTLGGIANDTQVTELTGYQTLMRGSAALLVAEWKVEVLTSH